VSRYPFAKRQKLRSVTLGREYRRLKQLNCPACQRQYSALQRTMTLLGARLRGHTRARVEKVMGPPDEVHGDGRARYIYWFRPHFECLAFDFGADSLAQDDWLIRH
jgi:hypothetical protein